MERLQFYEDLANKLNTDEDLVTQVVIDNFDGKDLDELTDEEYNNLVYLLS